MLAVTATFGSRIDDGQPAARAAGGFKMIVPGLAADSAAVQPIPEAWVFFGTSHYVTVAGYEYGMIVTSTAPAFTTENLAGRTQWGDGPSLIGPFEFLQGCSAPSQTSVVKIPLRTHGLILPSSGLPGDIILALEPATYRSLTKFSCPGASGEPPPFLIDTIVWWLVFHAFDFSGDAGAYLFANFAGPDPDDPACVIAKLESDKTKTVAGATLRELLDIIIMSDPECLSQD